MSTSGGAASFVADDASVATGASYGYSIDATSEMPPAF